MSCHTVDLTLPLWVMFLLCFSLAIRILCLATMVANAGGLKRDLAIHSNKNDRCKLRPLTIKKYYVDFCLRPQNKGSAHTGRCGMGSYWVVARRDKAVLHWACAFQYRIFFCQLTAVKYFLINFKVRFRVWVGVEISQPIVILWRAFSSLPAVGVSLLAITWILRPPRL